MFESSLACFNGPIIMIGCGSVGHALLPLLRRHLVCLSSHITIIDPIAISLEIRNEFGLRQIQLHLLNSNYKQVLDELVEKPGFIINLAVNVSSLDLIRWCRDNGFLYIDAGTDPWGDFYFSSSYSNAVRTNYYLREQLRGEQRSQDNSAPTAVSCCGANPGMVSWLLKEALLQLASDIDLAVATPTSRGEWANLMWKLGVKGVHISERDTQQPNFQRSPDTFVNTWSVDGFLAEGFQPAELGWGTHESWLPSNAKKHDIGSCAAIYLDQPGINTRVKTWSPTFGPQVGFLVTHNESISISDYYTIRENGVAKFRPTVHYAYHPCDYALLSLHETLGTGRIQREQHVLRPEEITQGFDELGVLLYGHGRNALWYGSHLKIEEARLLAPLQNATGLQVSSAMLAGIIWAIENPGCGLVEADEMDYKRCLDIQRKYLGSIVKKYTDWTPLDSQWSELFPKTLDSNDPWQFKNILI